MENVSYTTEVVADSIQFLEPRSASAEDRSGAGGGAPYQGAQQNEQPSYQNQQSTNNQQSISNQQPNQQNYTRTDDDPFSTGGGPIEVSDDDLPF